MINIHVDENSLSVTGHAERPAGVPPGHNIICAAVSALTLTLRRGLEEVAGIQLDGWEAPGRTRYIWGNRMNETGRALICAYVLGLEGIRDSYGEIEIE